MADHVSYGRSDRDLDQAIITLKKGTHLIKYSRKGKPKFCPFRLSTDEKDLVWLSHGEERFLKLSLVSRIIPGQRTAVFRRFLRPEKDYLSFSLIYNNGDRSLDVICKDKAEAEVWLAGLKALIGQPRNKRTRSEVPEFIDSEDAQNGRPAAPALEFASSGRSRTSLDCVSLSSDVGPEQANMQLRGSTGDGFRLSTDGYRLSVSSTPSCSSQGSGPDDIESLGDVYVWGELWSDGGLTDGSGNPNSTKVDVLTPKPLESNVVLDVHQIASGVRHVALVTRQGEVFTWGEESGGRLGHGNERDFTRPHLVEFLAVTNVNFVACGEFHSCAVSTYGDVFTWGDGVHHAGLLGHGTDASHWIPKRISGPLEGLQVHSIACGTWHTALVTSNGKLYTFGDGTFGVLGHGNRESVSYPKEVEQLLGLKAIKVACGVWHTVAIVEIMNSSNSGGGIASRKLCTWGDGDKYRLGHGNKEAYLVPTFVQALLDYNFQQIACGHNFTVALTTSGHVFTVGSASHGQLGNPQADGKAPCLVQDRLVGEYVDEISCGAYHVAVLTSRSEVYTWGKGANGRLGHGDVEDRKSPTLVEALKERLVKSVACGSNLTAVICIHKWVSGADQSVCSGCRQAFGFTRKRHNCYNCGLVHCHACSSKKAVRAALAPTPSKPHRVCDACHVKLKATATGNASYFNKRASSAPRRSIDSARNEKVESRSSRLLLSPITEPVKYLEVKSQKYGGKLESFSVVRASQVPTFQHLKDVAFPNSLSSLQGALKPAAPPPPPAPPVPSSTPARPSSPYTRRPSPPRSGTPVYSRGILDTLKKSNDLLSQEVSKLQNNLKTLKQKCEFQDEEIHKLRKNTREASLLAADRSFKSEIAREAVKAFSVKLKDIVKKFPSEAGHIENFMAMQTQILAYLETSENEASTSQNSLAEELQKLNLHRENEAPTSQTTLAEELQHLKSQTENEASTSQSTVQLQHEQAEQQGQQIESNQVDDKTESDQTPSISSDTPETAIRHDSEDGVQDLSILQASNQTLLPYINDSEDGLQDSNHAPSASPDTIETNTRHDPGDGGHVFSVIQDSNRTPWSPSANETTTTHDSEDGVHDSRVNQGLYQASLSSDAIETTHRNDSEHGVQGESLQENGGMQEPNPPPSPNMELTSYQGNTPLRLSDQSRSEVLDTFQFERGVYITYLQLSDGTRAFKRVRFSKKWFSGAQATEWWTENRRRVYREFSPAPQNNAQSGASTSFSTLPSTGQESFANDATPSET